MKEPPEGLTAPGRLLFVYLPDRFDDQSEERTARRCGSCPEIPTGSGSGSFRDPLDLMQPDSSPMCCRDHCENVRPFFGQTPTRCRDPAENVQLTAQLCALECTKSALVYRIAQNTHFAHFAQITQIEQKPEK